LYHWLAIGVLLLLAIIAYEDFRYRAVRIVWFVVAAAALLVLEWPRLYWIEPLINSGFILLQVTLLTCYFSLKEQQWINITHHYLGLGDVFFWGLAAIWFSPVNFIVFFLGSLLAMILPLWGLYHRAGKDFRIPLAGIQAVVMGIWLLLDYYFQKHTHRYDGWIEKLLF
jgi:hypothetical protein